MNRLLLIILAASSIAALPACESRRLPDEEQAAHTPISTSGAGNPLRLARDIVRAQVAVTRDPIEAPLDEAWKGTAGSPKVDDNGNGLVLQEMNEPHCLDRDLELDTALFNQFVVDMKADRGSVCRLTWESSLEADFARNPGVSASIFADGEFHRYVLPLRQDRAETWAGRLERIRFVPSDLPTGVVIRAMEFRFLPPESPDSVTIQDQTHEAVLASRLDWDIVVPSSGVFETYVGMMPRAWEACGSDGARLRATITPAEGKPMALVDQLMAPPNKREHRRWIRCRAAIGAYAGQEARISFFIDPLRSTQGDYAYWGNPMVYSAQKAKDGVPVVLISCDTVRADHLSCYGYERETTPYLDQWARDDAVLFENAIVQETWTLPSHASMLTGLYPKHHGVTSSTRLPERIRTLAEVLSNARYLTAGFTSFKWWLEGWRGFSDGFDVYCTPTQARRGVFETHRLAQNWLDEHDTSRWFLFLHNFEAHARVLNEREDLPYGPSDPAFLHFAEGFRSPEAFESAPRGTELPNAANEGDVTLSDEEKAYVMALYDDSIRCIDRAIFEFFNYLKSRAVYDAALIIVTSDHGEDFGEHGVYGHGHVYESSCRVPLIVKFPFGKFGGTRFPGQVQSVDLYPTVLDVLGMPSAEAADGTSLKAMLEGRRPPHNWTYSQRFARQAVRGPEWKLIRDNFVDGYELYHLATDPDEKMNLYRAEDPPAPFAQLAAELDRFYRINQEQWHVALCAGDQHLDISVVATTDGRFDSIHLAAGDRTGATRLSKERSAVHGTVAVRARTCDEMMLKTIPADARVSLRIQSAEPFSTLEGNAAHNPSTDYQVMLDPANERFRNPPDMNAPETPRPAVAAWYVEPALIQPPAKELSEEAVEQLRAMGYVGEIE